MSDPASSPSGAGAAADPRPEQMPGSPHTRRYVILRILGAVLIIGVAIAVQRLWLRDEPSRNTFGATVRTKEIDSTALGRTMPVKVVVPKGAPANGRGLVVFLHGRGEDESSYLVEPMFEALASLKTRAPVIAFPDGGDSSYWHDRDSGAWSSYVLKDVIPELVRRFDIDPSKIAIGGISMGGFGAYDIARLAPARFCAVGGHSPVIWTTSGDTADGAFDDADDFNANNVIDIAGSPSKPYDGMKLWIDAGNDDPFLDGDAAFEQALKDAGAHVVVKDGSGGHDLKYWNGNWGEYLDWYAHVLRGCGEAAAREAKGASGKPGRSDRPKPAKQKPGAGASGTPSGPSSRGAASGASSAG
jgi:S-formylglutathione hydrolase FrmB